MTEYEILIETINPCGGSKYAKKEFVEAEAESPEAYVAQHGKYSLRVFSCLDTFLLRQNCSAPASDVFSSDFWFLRRRRADARQGKKGKKRRKDALSGVFALVNRWYLNKKVSVR